MSREVTAVITTHGRPASVQEAIASVRAELHENIEIVVVDDGGEFTPSDVTLRVVRGLQLGVGRARNLGLAEARGEFVIFLDDDDVALPARIATLVETARRHRADICFGMTRRRLDDSAQILESVPTHLLEPGPIGFCDLLTCAPHINAVLARTDVLRDVGGFDVEASHFDDWSAWLRIADCDGVIWSVADVVAEWRIHERGLTADLLQRRAMKTRLLSLFDRLQSCLSDDNARAVATAHRIVASADIITYDDYADVMASAREQLRRATMCVA